MQAYLLSGLGSPTSSVNFILPLPRLRVSNQYQYSSFHYHYHNNNQSKQTLHHHYHRPKVIFPAAAVTNRYHQNHYAIIGISTTASSTEIKRSYRLLAKKYHPDVWKDSKSGEVFKSIRHAYDILSNEVTRAQYDFKLGLQKKEKFQAYATYPSPVESDTSEEKSSVRDSFSNVLSVICFLNFMYRVLSQQDLFLSIMGYLIARFFGWYRKGSLLTLSRSFESLAFGKEDVAAALLLVVTSIVVVMWV